MYRGLLVNHEKVVKFLNFICGSKIKLWEKFSDIFQVNPDQECAMDKIEKEKKKEKKIDAYLQYCHYAQ